MHAFRPVIHPICRPNLTLIPALILAAALVSSVPAAPISAPEAQITARLQAIGFPAGAAVRSVMRDGSTLTVDFTPETAAGLTDGSFETLADAVRDAFRDQGPVENWAFTANGHPLSDALPPSPVVTPQAKPRARRSAAIGALSGKTIALSPGHGWTYYGSPDKATNPYWQSQRAFWQGIIEDYLNQEMIQYVYNLLKNNGAEVAVTREMDKTAGQCDTAFTFDGLSRPAPNLPWWHMGALYYAYSQGAPSTVWDISGLNNDYDRDIAVRPLFANWKNADIMVSLHNNGDSGTASGTETLYDTQNGQTVTDSANQYGSQYLAQKIQSHVVSIVRANYRSSWVDRAAQGFAGSYGENRRATRPACLIEVAFMDKPTPDNAALHDESFKMLVAKGIYEGICDYFHVKPTYNTTVDGARGTWPAQPLAKAWGVKLDTTKTPGAAVNAPVSASGGWAYGATDAGVVYGVAATTASGLTPGTVQWKYPATGNMGAPVRARVAVYKDSVFAVTTKGMMVAVNRLTGAPLWAAPVIVPNSGNLVSSPSPTSDGTLVIGSDNGRLYAYRQSDGALLKSFPFTFGAIRGQASIPDSGHVWVGSDDGKVRCLSWDLDVVLWEQNTGAPVSTSPFVLTKDNTVFYVNAGRKVFGANASNGGTPDFPAAGYDVPANIGTSPWVDADGRLIVYGEDNHTIDGVDLNGAEIPDLPLKPYGVQSFTSAPVVLNGVIYAGGNDGKLYALKRSDGVSDPGADWRAFDSASQGLPGQFTAAPCLTGTGPDDRVVAGCTNGYLYGFPL